MAKKLTDRQRRCEDCPNLKITSGKWTCEECFGQMCEDIDDCPEGVTLEDIERIDKEMKHIKINVGAHAEVKKERTPRERKPDEEKETLIADVADFLTGIAENVKITNVSKIIEFDIGENHYKFDLIRQRKPKN